MIIVGADERAPGRGVTAVRVLVGVISFLLWFAAPVLAGEVTAAGMAPILDSDVLGARKAALEEAKRAAVEQALGSYVESRTEVSDFSLASDKIYSTVQGRIERFDIILDERQPGDVYRVEIVATFEDEALVSETEALLKKYHWHKKPRLLVSVTGEGEALSRPAAQQLQQQLEKKFRSQGFEVFSNDRGNANRAGFLLEASAFIANRELEYQGITLANTELSVTATLSRVGSGQIIASSSYNGSKAGANQAKALKSLGKDAANSVYKDLNRELSEEWLRNQSRGTDVVLELSGNSISSKVPSIKSGLSKNLRGVRSITVVSAGDSTAVLSVVYMGWPEQLYDEIAAALARNQDLNLTLNGISGNTLQLEVL